MEWVVGWGLGADRGPGDFDPGIHRSLPRCLPPAFACFCPATMGRSTSEFWCMRKMTPGGVCSVCLLLLMLGTVRVGYRLPHHANQISCTDMWKMMTSA